MPFERRGWSVEQIDANTRRWVYIASHATPGAIQHGTVRIDPNVDGNSNPQELFGSRGIEEMEAAAAECMDRIRRWLRDRP